MGPNEKKLILFCLCTSHTVFFALCIYILNDEFLLSGHSVYLKKKEETKKFYMNIKKK